MGTWCKLKTKCARYTPIFTTEESNYLPSVPYDPIKESCRMFIGFYEADYLKSITVKNGRATD
jgi:dTDP-D-glucose 4,6-dehydratase